MKQELLDLAYAQMKDYVYDCSQREFDCLIELIEDGTIKTFEQLAQYGISKWKLLRKKQLNFGI